MISLIKVLYLLSFLVAVGYSLSCTECYALSADSCTGGHTTQCKPDEDVCAYAIFKYGKNELFARSCGKKSLSCDISGSIDVDMEPLQIATTCCSTDHCVPKTPKSPDKSHEKNGVSCPVCFNTSSECRSKETIECTGAETNCTTIQFKIAEEPSLQLSLRGCATPSICNLGNNTVIADYLNVNVGIVCNDTGYIRYSLLFLVVALSIVLKNNY